MLYGWREVWFRGSLGQGGSPDRTPEVSKPEERYKKLRTITQSHVFPPEEELKVQFAMTWLNPTIPLRDKLAYIHKSEDSNAKWALLQEWDSGSPYQNLQLLCAKGLKFVSVTDFVEAAKVMVKEWEALEAFLEHTHPTAKAGSPLPGGAGVVLGGRGRHEPTLIDTNRH